ncbi:unnamed protein product [Adineta ricciae]|uniref:RRM domain-containing protein n=1 Tax=Adineta ricciae TaxID=249248 RepID=A0A814X2B6_ADIRI|nr:unnamed protein product [Adineta ricciae]
MLNLQHGSVMSNNRKLQFLLESKLSTDEKVPKTGRILRNKIFVIGFPPNCTELDLENFFSNFGPVRETRIVKDENGVTKGYAFITFVKERSVVHALEYRVPLYFMDRKLSINPAIKKQQSIPTERCLSSTTSIDTPSDLSNSSNQTNDRNLFATYQQYYNPNIPPYFPVNVPFHPIYCASSSEPIWQQYYSTTTTTYPSYPYLSMAHHPSGGYSVFSQICIEEPSCLFTIRVTTYEALIQAIVRRVKTTKILPLYYFDKKTNVYVQLDENDVRPFQRTTHVKIRLGKKQSAPYEGELNDEGEKHGYGMYRWSNGRTYVGQWYRNQMDGDGVESWPNGSKYQGQFRGNKRHGRGTFTWADGRQYIGEYRNDYRHGYGICTFPNGYKYEGQWWQGKKHGRGIEIFPDGHRYNGVFQDDKSLGLVSEES